MAIQLKQLRTYAMKPILVALFFIFLSNQTDARTVTSAAELPFYIKPESATNIVLSASHTKPIPTSSFEHEFQLDQDGNYWLFWNVSDGNITFEVHVRTRGYVGFGLSSNGKMFPSDVVVGWVNSDGTTHFHDCHTVSHSTPIRDKSQDWSLLNGQETDFGTVLTFTRMLDTCDDDDVIVTDDTIKIIFSYHPDDPGSIQGMQWHGVKRRGTKSLMFLSYGKSDHVMPNDTFNVDLQSSSYRVPMVDTRYQCTIHKLPPMYKRHHMIRYEPLIQKENVDYVHHIVLSMCPYADENDVGASFECYAKSTPRRFMKCNEVVLTWAVGGTVYNFPENVGYPFGDSHLYVYLKLEIHYNNPTLKSDIVDSSGIRMVLTPNVRQNDAGTMTLGVNVHPTHFIPPFQKQFLSTGFCPSECTERTLPKSGLKVFALLQHSHLLGTGIRTRHIRNGTELSPIAEDDHYDFDYQDVRALKKERTIKPGDSFMVECTYDSSQKNKPTLGGLSTQEEMCVSFLYYYPRAAISVCISIPRYEQVAGNATEATRQLKGWNWKDPTVQQTFQDLVNNSTHHFICSGNKSNEYHQFNGPVDYPELSYQKPTRVCQT